MTVVPLGQEGSTSGVSDAATLDELAFMVWASTFYHAVIGDFQLDNVIKGNLPLLDTGKQHVQTKSYGTLSTTIGVTTMARTCNMETYRLSFPKNRNERFGSNSIAPCSISKLVSPNFDDYTEQTAEERPIYTAINS